VYKARKDTKVPPALKEVRVLRVYRGPLVLRGQPVTRETRVTRGLKVLKVLRAFKER
jgi:hypothetical protein